MRNVIIWASAILVFLAVVAGAPALAASANAASAKPPVKTEHPANVALLQEPNRWIYVQFPTNLRLYVSDRDGPGTSACNVGCDMAWPPLQPSEMDTTKPIGDWSVIKRHDGSKQWAYKGRPVYLRYHDSIEAPTGNGVDGVWRFLEP
jgi:predicted lipoprotein with Yx(FWY)xxD motif